MTASLAEIRETAVAVVAVRADWELGAVLTVLMSCREKGTNDQLRTAATRAASDPHTRAPVAITWPVFWTGKRSTTTTFVPANPLPECRHCATPAKRNAPPEFCMGCGRPWDGVVHRVDRIAERAAAVPCPEHLREAMRGLWK